MGNEKAPLDLAERSPGKKKLFRLETEPERQLDSSRAPATEERIADSYVAGGGELVASVADLTRVLCVVVGLESAPAT